MSQPTIDDLGLTLDQKVSVLEWYAHKVCHVEPNACCCAKMYDPLTIEGHVAYSYTFDFRDGGRHHPFGSYAELETMLDEELRKKVKP